MKYYKTTQKDRNGTHTAFQYPEINIWTTPVEGKLIACENGYHFCTIEQLPEWLSEEIYEVEVDGDILNGYNKLVSRSIRLNKKLNWNEKTQRLFAADCAEHVLHIFEDEYPDDDRPRKAIEAVRKFVYGEISKEELSAAYYAACDAAYDAARVVRNGAACYDAACDAARATRKAAHAARKAAEAAVRAAWDTTCAARKAAEAAVRAAKDKKAERKWQAKRLEYYLYEFEG